MKVAKFSIFIMLSSYLTTWTTAASPLLYPSGIYANGANTKPLVVANSQQAARLVKSQYGGKVLKVQRTKVKGNQGYKVKLLKDNGHVISVKVDAKSGKLSGR
ncbi:PepSY domain-containing protein [Colwelliaceae bacterium 6441]